MDKYEKEAQRLRKDILRVYVKPVEYNTDCDGLATDIVTKTQRRISASTLKRLFGFVKRTSNFSKHTYDTLSRYVGFESWLDYINIGKQTIETPYSNELWTTISEGAFKITEHSLKTIKDCAGIDFDKVIPRQFAEDKVERFMKSDKLAMAFVAPGNSGKSVIAANITERFFLSTEKDNPYKNDLVWLIDGALIGNVIGNNKDLKSWVYEQMGYDSERDLISVLHNNPHYRLGRLVLIVDGFNEITVEEDKLDRLIGDLMSSLSTVVHIDWFKIILTCRPNTWFKVVNKISDNKSLQNAWFETTFSNNYYDVINVPELTDDEVQEVIDNYSDTLSFKQIIYRNVDIEKELRNPKFLQLFLTYADPLEKGEIDLYLNFVAETIVKGQEGENKLNLLNALIKKTNYGKNGSKFHFTEIESIVNQYKTAYSQLLSYGFVFESKKVDKYLTVANSVSFAQPKFFEFLVANLWLRENEFGMDLIKRVDQFYNGHSLHPKLMEWMLRYALFEQNMDVLKEVHQFISDKIQNEQSYITAPQASKYFDFLSLIAVEIRKNAELRKKLVPELAVNPVARKLHFEMFNDIDNLALSGNSGKDYVDHYLSNATTIDEKIFGSHMKFMKYFLSYDHRRTGKVFDSMREIGEDGASPASLGMSYACQIMYDNFVQEIPAKQFERNIFQIGNDLAKSESALTDFPYYQYFTIEAYNLCGKHYEAQKMYKKIKNPYINLEAYKEHILYKMLSLYNANAMIKQKEDKKYFEQAFEILKDFEDNALPNLPINGRNYYTLRYYLVKLDFLDFENRIEDRIDLVRKVRSLADMMRFEFFKEEMKKVKRDNREKLREQL